jgi:hypothetical protein
MCGIERVVLAVVGSMALSLASAEPQYLLQATANAMPHHPLRADIRPAQRDPFELAPVAASGPPLPPVVLQPLVLEVAPIQPVIPPPPTLAYAGRMRAADGRWLVMVQLEDGRPVALQVGKELGNGYRVERMSDRVVELLNPQTQHLMQLAVPAAPRFETW